MHRSIMLCKTKMHSHNSRPITCMHSSYACVYIAMYTGSMHASMLEISTIYTSYISKYQLHNADQVIPRDFSRVH